jgi:HEAT repeat protein
LVTAAPVIAEELHKQVLPADPQEAQIDSLRQTIENRAKLAQALGFLGVKSPEVIDALEDLVRQPTVHPDPNWSRLDGGLAAWALGTLQAKEGAGVLKDALLTARSFRPMASENVNKSEAVTRGLPIDRVHWFAAFALAEIGTDEALIGLETAMNSPPDPELVENDRLGGLAARALARFRVESRAPILAKLLVHENSLVRRAGVLGCLQETDPACRTLLELGASWAVPWWDVQHAKP